MYSLTITYQDTIFFFPITLSLHRRNCARTFLNYSEFIFSGSLFLESTVSAVSHFKMYIASDLSFFACISSSLIWNSLILSSNKYFPTTWIPVWWIICAEFLFQHFLYLYFNDWSISRFIFISSRAVFGSISRTKVSRHRLTSSNRKLNGGFDDVIGRR